MKDVTRRKPTFFFKENSQPPKPSKKNDENITAPGHKLLDLLLFGTQFKWQNSTRPNLRLINIYPWTPKQTMKNGGFLPPKNMPYNFISPKNEGFGGPWYIYIYTHRIHGTGLFTYMISVKNGHRKTGKCRYSLHIRLCISHDGSMGLAYLPTWIINLCGKCSNYIFYHPWILYIYIHSLVKGFLVLRT